jgi:3-methyladenine DNA glycosylase AlkD
MDVDRIARDLDRALREHTIPGRAAREKAYLKSSLDHYGVPVPAVRSLARDLRRSRPDLARDDLVALVVQLWTVPVHERRMLAVELLHAYSRLLETADLGLIERLLREARTWALVDGLSASVVGALVQRLPQAADTLDRWAADEDFWLRRSALLALLVPLRSGEGDFDRFSRYADAMLEEREFFIRKAIGWVLRDTGRARPDLVYAWLLPRAGRASGVTLREAVKPLSTPQRRVIEDARASGR